MLYSRSDLSSVYESVVFVEAIGMTQEVCVFVVMIGMLESSCNTHLLMRMLASSNQLSIIKISAKLETSC